MTKKTKMFSLKSNGATPLFPANTSLRRGNFSRRGFLDFNFFKLLARISFVLIISTAISFPALAEQPQAQSVSAGPRRQLATIVFAGLGGAVLGLSTLSFYGRPQDYLSNIAMGFAAGIIIGTIVVTYKAASAPQDFYGSPPPAGAQLDNTIRNRDLLLSQSGSAPELNLKFEF